MLKLFRDILSYRSTKKVTNQNPITIIGWESMISRNSRGISRNRRFTSRFFVSRYIYPIYFCAIFVNKRIHIDEASKFAIKSSCVCGTRTRREAANREKKEREKNPPLTRFGIYLKIEYPRSKNAIPPDLRNQGWNFLFFLPSNGRPQFRTHDYTLSPRHLFFLFAKKSFVSSSFSSNRKKGGEREESYFKIKREWKCKRERRGSTTIPRNDDNETMETLSHFRILPNVIRHERAAKNLKTEFFFFFRQGKTVDHRSFGKHHRDGSGRSTPYTSVHHHFFLPRNETRSKTKRAIVKRRIANRYPLLPPPHHSRATRAFKVRWTFVFFLPSTHHLRSHP